MKSTTRRSTRHIAIHGYWNNDICRYPGIQSAPSEAEIWAKAKVLDYFGLPATADFTDIPGYTGFHSGTGSCKGQNMYQYQLTTTDTVYHFWFPGDKALA